MNRSFMKIFKALIYGTNRSIRSWKGVLTIWFLYLLLVSMVAIPLKGSLMAGFGKSMITERLSDGLNIEVFVDLGSALGSLISSFSYGFFFLIAVGFIMNAFLSGGLFNTLRGASKMYSSSEFFKTAATNFWSFFFIITIAIGIIIFFTIIILVIPLSAVSNTESATDRTIFYTVIICGSLLFILTLIILIVTDYARAWQAAVMKPACFRAIGFGFRQTLRTFLSSFALMIIIMFVSILFGWLVLKILPAWRPSNFIGILFLFIVSQFLFFLKIMLRAWRYASITSLMEQELKYRYPDLINPK